MKIFAAMNSARRCYCSLLLLIALSTAAEAQWVAQFWDNANSNIGAVQPTSDGGYITAGARDFFFAYSRRIMKLDRSGNIDWQRIYLPNGDNWENAVAYAIQQTDDDADGQADDGYMVAGQATFFDGAGTAIWLLKLDPAGNVTWDMSYSTGFHDNAYSVQQTGDGGYVVAGLRGGPG